MSLVLRHGQAFSPIYRFSLSDGTIVSAHTKSKLVRSPATNEPQLYMSLHILQRYASLPVPVLGRETNLLHETGYMFKPVCALQHYLLASCVLCSWVNL